MMTMAGDFEAEQDLGRMVAILATAEGSGSHPYPHAADLRTGALATRNIADMLHLLSMLHGPQPGLIERAGETNIVPAADGWMVEAAMAFALERSYLTQLIVAAGPAPSTPGETDTAAAIRASQSALATIARSERFGCALGAAIAMVFDWRAIRVVLDAAATRMGVPSLRCMLPGEEETAAVLARLPDVPRLDRTLAFGARQLLFQHRGLWDLLEARTSAREDY